MSTHIVCIVEKRLCKPTSITILACEGIIGLQGCRVSSDSQTAHVLMVKIIRELLTGVTIDTNTRELSNLVHRIFHRQHRTRIPQATRPNVIGILTEYLWETLFHPPYDLTHLTDAYICQLTPMVIGIVTYQFQPMEDILPKRCQFADTVRTKQYFIGCIVVARLTEIAGAVTTIVNDGKRFLVFWRRCQSPTRMTGISHVASRGASDILSQFLFYRQLAMHEIGSHTVGYVLLDIWTIEP